MKKGDAMGSVLWTSVDVGRALNAEVHGTWAATGVSIDSRSLQKGDLFFAIMGDNSDGHQYVKNALDNGAVAVVVSKDVKDVPQDKVLMVRDTFVALQDLGKASRARTGATIIGITGSVGKTGTKELLATGFSALGQTHASIKSYNNHWGVPLSLSSMHAGCDYAIFEMGMNHSGEIKNLSRQVRPDISIITTIAPVHVGNFENGMEGIAAAKSEILEGMDKGGKIILNRDNEWFDYIARAAVRQGVEVFGFGEHAEADCRLMECLEASNGTRVKANVMGEEVSYTLQIAGKHVALNSLSVLLAVKLAGGDVKTSAQALSKQEPIAGRGKREQIDIGDKNNPITLIDESYNASPTSMRAAFKVLALIDPGRGGRRIAFLGDMLELGADGPAHHRDLALPIKAANIDLVYTSGKLMKNLYDTLPSNQRGEHKDTSADLAKIVPEVLVPGDVVMVKGSLGSKMGAVVEAMRALPDRSKSKKAGG